MGEWRACWQDMPNRYVHDMGVTSSRTQALKVMRKAAVEHADSHPSAYIMRTERGGYRVTGGGLHRDFWVEEV